MPRFYAVSSIRARFVTEFEAPSREEALKIARRCAEKKFGDADFGPAEEIDFEYHHLEDERGNYIQQESEIVR